MVELLGDEHEFEALIPVRDGVRDGVRHFATGVFAVGAGPGAAVPVGAGPGAAVPVGAGPGAAVPVGDAPVPRARVTGDVLFSVLKDGKDTTWSVRCDLESNEATFEYRFERALQVDGELRRERHWERSIPRDPP